MQLEMVFDIPADSGGALSILRRAHADALADHGRKYIFVVGLPELDSRDNVTVLRCPAAKKSWLHRIWFDIFTAPRLVRKYRPDTILSLQNLTVPFVKTPQTVYLHQPLPFIDIKYTLKSNPKFWIYQNIIGKMICRSLRRADRVVVQTEWMKAAAAARARICPEKIEVRAPQIALEGLNPYAPAPRPAFVYPADAYDYKNHDMIVRAAAALRERGIGGYEIVFTLSGDESPRIRALYEKCRADALPVVFAGRMEQARVYELYSRSALLFASTVETFGLPLLEARSAGAPVLAADTPFAREILDGYGGARLYRWDDPQELSSLMEEYITGRDGV